MSSYYTLEKDAIKLQRSELSDPYRIRNKYSHGFKTFLFIYLATCSLWDFSSPKAEVVKVLVAQLCPTLFDPMDHSPRGSSVWGISQVRILEWVAVSFSRGSSQPRDWTASPALQVDSLPSEPSPTFSSSSRDQTCAPAAEARCMSWAFI